MFIELLIIGYCWILGILIATFGYILPSLLIVSLLAFIYYRYKTLSLLQSVLASLRPAVVRNINITLSNVYWKRYVDWVLKFYWS